jgi:hypothetical protein
MRLNPNPTRRLGSSRRRNAIAVIERHNLDLSLESKRSTAPPYESDHGLHGSWAVSLNDSGLTLPYFTYSPTMTLGLRL